MADQERKPWAEQVAEAKDVTSLKDVYERLRQESGRADLADAARERFRALERDLEDVASSLAELEQAGEAAEGFGQRLRVFKRWFREVAHTIDTLAAAEQGEPVEPDAIEEEQEVDVSELRHTRDTLAGYVREMQAAAGAQRLGPWLEDKLIKDLDFLEQFGMVEAGDPGVVIAQLAKVMDMRLRELVVRIEVVENRDKEDTRTLMGVMSDMLEKSAKPSAQPEKGKPGEKKPTKPAKEALPPLDTVADIVSSPVARSAIRQLRERFEHPTPQLDDPALDRYPEYVGQLRRLVEKKYKEAGGDQQKNDAIWEAAGVLDWVEEMRAKQAVREVFGNIRTSIETTPEGAAWIIDSAEQLQRPEVQKAIAAARQFYQSPRVVEGDSARSDELKRQYARHLTQLRSRVQALYRAIQADVPATSPLWHEAGVEDWIQAAQQEDVINDYANPDPQEREILTFEAFANPMVRQAIRKAREGFERARDVAALAELKRQVLAIYAFAPDEMKKNDGYWDGAGVSDWIEAKKQSGKDKEAREGAADDRGYIEAIIGSDIPLRLHAGEPGLTRENMEQVAEALRHELGEDPAQAIPTVQAFWRLYYPEALRDRVLAAGKSGGAKDLQEGLRLAKALVQQEAEAIALRQTTGEMGTPTMSQLALRLARRICPGNAHEDMRRVRGLILQELIGFSMPHTKPADGDDHATAAGGVEPGFGFAEPYRRSHEPSKKFNYLPTQPEGAHGGHGDTHGHHAPAKTPTKEIHQVGSTTELLRVAREIDLPFADEHGARKIKHKKFGPLLDQLAMREDIFSDEKMTQRLWEWYEAGEFNEDVNLLSDLEGQKLFGVSLRFDGSFVSALHHDSTFAVVQEMLAVHRAKKKWRKGDRKQQEGAKQARAHGNAETPREQAKRELGPHEVMAAMQERLPRVSEAYRERLDTFATASLSEAQRGDMQHMADGAVDHLWHQIPAEWQDLLDQEEFRRQCGPTLYYVFVGHQAYADQRIPLEFAPREARALVAKQWEDLTPEKTSRARRAVVGDTRRNQVLGGLCAMDGVEFPMEADQATQLAAIRALTPRQLRAIDEVIDINKLGLNGVAGILQQRLTRQWLSDQVGERLRQLDLHFVPVGPVVEEPEIEPDTTTKTVAIHPDNPYQVLGVSSESAPFTEINAEFVRRLATLDRLIQELSTDASRKEEYDRMREEHAKLVAAYHRIKRERGVRARGVGGEGADVAPAGEPRRARGRRQERRENLSVESILENYLCYKDVISPDQLRAAMEESFKNPNDVHYAETFGGMLRDHRSTVGRIRGHVRTYFDQAVGRLSLATTPYGRSDTWIHWDLAKQRYLSQHPNESDPTRYTLADPLSFATSGESQRVIQDIADRHLGWELFGANHAGLHNIREQLNTQHATYRQIIKLLDLPPRDLAHLLSSYQLTELGRLIRENIGIPNLTFDDLIAAERKGDATEEAVAEEDFVFLSEEETPAGEPDEPGKPTPAAKPKSRARRVAEKIATPAIVAATVAGFPAGVRFGHDLALKQMEPAATGDAGRVGPEGVVPTSTTSTTAARREAIPSGDGINLGGGFRATFSGAGREGRPELPPGAHGFDMDGQPFGFGWKDKDRSLGGTQPPRDLEKNIVTGARGERLEIRLRHDMWSRFWRLQGEFAKAFPDGTRRGMKTLTVTEGYRSANEKAPKTPRDAEQGLGTTLALHMGPDAEVYDWLTTPKEGERYPLAVEHGFVLTEPNKPGQWRFVGVDTAQRYWDQYKDQILANRTAAGGR